jgi:hypothetical protein
MRHEFGGEGGEKREVVEGMGEENLCERGDFFLAGANRNVNSK